MTGGLPHKVSASAHPSTPTPVVREELTVTILPEAHPFVAELPSDRRCLLAGCGRRRSHGIHVRTTGRLVAAGRRTTHRSTYRLSGTPFMARQGEFRALPKGA